MRIERFDRAESSLTSNRCVLANSGLSTSRKTKGADIMLPGTLWAHIHVMGAP
jgi:hypothetical protein